MKTLSQLQALRPLTLTVIGEPTPQGSKRHVGKGILVESSAKVKPWREAVVWAAREARHPVVFSGPTAVGLYFYLRRPKSAPKGVKRPYRKPDIDKLVRSTLDSLVMAGVLDDDARVVQLIADKRFAGAPDALDVPGARIHIWACEED